MDKNTVTGLILISIVLFGYFWWAQPSAEQLAEQARQDSIAAVVQQKAAIEKKKKAEAVKKANEEAALDSTALFHAALNVTAQKVVLKNEKVELTLNSKGGVVEKAVVKGYADCNGNPDVTLFDERVQTLNYTL